MKLSATAKREHASFVRSFYGAPEYEEINDEPLFEIKNVEVFATGVHNGDSYDENDLDEMVRAAPLVGFNIPLKKGHSKDVGGRAFGWIRNLRRTGSKLIADFCDVPASLHRIIRERGYDSVSAEIFWNLERGGRTFARALKAVALLGSEIPAVAGLAPLRTVVNAHGSDDVRTVVFSKGVHQMQYKSFSDAGEEVVRRTKKRMREARELTYAQAMKEVLEDDPELKKAYAQPATAKAY